MNYCKSLYSYLMIVIGARSRDKLELKLQLTQEKMYLGFKVSEKIEMQQ